MKLHKLLPVLGVVLATNMAMATPESDWNRLLGSYNKMQRAKDTKAMTTFLGAHFAPEFKFILVGGKALNHRDFVMQEMDMVYMMKDFTTAKISISNFVAKGDNATSKGRFTFAGTTKPVNGGKPGRLSVNGSFNAKFVRRDGKWLMSEVKETSSKATINGKPITR